MAAPNLLGMFHPDRAVQSLQKWSRDLVRYLNERQKAHEDLADSVSSISVTQSGPTSRELRQRIETWIPWYFPDPLSTTAGFGATCRYDTTYGMLEIVDGDAAGTLVLLINYDSGTNSGQSGVGVCGRNGMVLRESTTTGGHAPQQAARFHKMMAESGSRLAVCTTANSVRTTPIPFSSGAQAWTAETIAGTATKRVIAVHYSRIHALWVVIVLIVGAPNNYELFTSSSIAPGTWTSRVTCSPALTGGGTIAESDTGVLVAMIGDDVGAGNDVAQVYRSIDGTTWAAAASFAAPTFVNGYGALTWSSYYNKFFLCSEASMFSSEDGDTWTDITPADWDTVLSIAADEYGTLLVARDPPQHFTVDTVPTVGDDLVHQYSLDEGVTWTTLGLIWNADQDDEQEVAWVSYAGNRFFLNARRGASSDTARSDWLHSTPPIY